MRVLDFSKTRFYLSADLVGSTCLVWRLWWNRVNQVEYCENKRIVRVVSEVKNGGIRTWSFCVNKCRGKQDCSARFKNSYDQWNPMWAIKIDLHFRFYATIAANIPGFVKKLDSVVSLICVHFSDLSLYVRNFIMLDTKFIWEFCVVVWLIL